MSAPLHTPGPWAVVPYGDGNSLVIHHSKRDRVCFMAMPTTQAEYVAIQANARLIAAAPMMLEALTIAHLQFLLYAKLHREKLSEDGLRKARVNEEMAATMKAAIDAATLLPGASL